MLRPLAKRVVDAGSGGSFFCVGDVKQAIYGWRGGVAEIFDALDEQVAGLTAQQLDESYRSAQPVIDAVNQVFQNLTKHPQFDKLTEPWPRGSKQFPAALDGREANLPGYVTLADCARCRRGGRRPEAAVRVCRRARLREAVPTAPRRSIGVLVRTNTAVARLIYRAAASAAFQASEEGGNPLIDSPAVELILSLLRAGRSSGRQRGAVSPGEFAAGRRLWSCATIATNAPRRPLA